MDPTLPMQNTPGLPDLGNNSEEETAALNNSLTAKENSPADAASLTQTQVKAVPLPSPGHTVEDFQQPETSQVEEGLHNTVRPSNGADASDVTSAVRSASIKNWMRSHKVALFAAGVVLIGLVVAGMMWWQLYAALPSAEQVSDSFDAVALEEQLTDSPYASNTGYVVDGVETKSVERNGASGATAQVEATYHNDSFVVVVHARQDFERMGGVWSPAGSEVLDVAATPSEAPEADAVLADIETVLAKVAPHDGTSIERIYDGGSFEVAKRELAPDKKSATVSIVAHKMGALYEYEGTVTAEFSFEEGKASDDAGAWRLTGATANDEAFTRSDAPIQGSWTGTFEKTTTSAQLFSTGVCEAAKESPLKLTVKAYDSVTGQLTCDMSFVVHGHGALDASADHSSGDARVTLRGARVQLNPKTLEGTITSSDVSAAEKKAQALDAAEKSSEDTDTDDAMSELEWGLFFKNEGGIWRVQVASGLKSHALWGIGKTTFTDYYELLRAN